MSFWQSKSWGEMLNKSKQVDKIIYLGDLLIEKRSIGFGKYGLFVLGVENIKNIDKEGLVKICKKENCVFVQIETVNSFSVISSMKPWKSVEELNNEISRVYAITKVQIPPLQSEGQLLSSNSLKPGGQKAFSFFNPGYYKKFITPYTAIIDLSKTEEEILSEMKPKGRYNIRLAEKKEIEVKEVEKTDENIKQFYALILQTTSRDNFSGNTFDYYRIFLEMITNSSLLIAYKDGIAISAGIFVFEIDYSIYYYGASTNDEKYRNLMAPYLLQWTAIKKAKEFGSRYYDFLGVATPGEKNSSLSGVTDFKMKFTKNIVNISNSYIWVNEKLIYLIFIGMKYLKKLIKK